MKSTIKKLGKASNPLPKVKSQLEKNKSAQMMFKTSLRNHLDLSGLADGKASTMMNINTLIITIALPFLLPKIEDYPNLIIPAVILLCTCIISIIYATLVTRPHKMGGYTNQEAIQSGKGNLFFFGNFFKMDFEEYLEGIHLTLKNQDNLDETIIRDLFMSGKTLGAKYQKLRYCYLVFIVGIVLSAISFLSLSLLQQSLFS